MPRATRFVFDSATPRNPTGRCARKLFAESDSNFEAWREKYFCLSMAGRAQLRDLRTGHSHVTKRPGLGQISAGTIDDLKYARSTQPVDLFAATRPLRKNSRALSRRRRRRDRIGAGIAGLGAAVALKDRGLEPLVLEAEARVGGRMDHRIALTDS